MKLYRKVYTNIQSGAEVSGPWFRNFGQAMRSYMKGDSYMNRHPNYSSTIWEEPVGLLEWLRKAPKP